MGFDHQLECGPYTGETWCPTWTGFYHYPRIMSVAPGSEWAPIFTAVCTCAFGCVVVLDIGRRYFKSAIHRDSHPLSPGPPGLPFLGNVIGLNADDPWLTYAEWAKSYGDLIYTRLFGKQIIVINSERIAKELLEDRSSNYSDRPYLITNELCGIDFNSAFMTYGDRWRSHRRFFHQTFRHDAVHRFVSMQHRKSCQLLRRLFEKPDDLAEHVFEYTSSLILSSVYDYDAKSRQEEIVDVVARVLEVIVPATRLDVAIIIGAFPALLNLPSWIPGMSFKKKMAAAKEFSTEYIERPFAYTMHEMRSGSISSSMVCDALQKIEEKGAAADKTWMKALKEAAATGFLAASETSNSVLMTFFLMMVVYPEVQKKAQAEIDAVIGKNRLPTIEDRLLLPYVDAVFRETLRYNPVVPLALPHVAVNEDVYAGYHIPKGAILMPNAWAMAHDETKYPHPHEFIPEPFLNEDGSLKPNDLENIIFGFGRRICVGRHFADTSVWSVIVKFLSVFEILNPIDDNGVEVPVEPKFSSGSSIHPLPFRCRIVPRISGMDVAKLDELIAGSSSD